MNWFKQKIHFCGASDIYLDFSALTATHHCHPVVLCEAPNNNTSPLAIIPLAAAFYQNICKSWVERKMRVAARKMKFSAQGAFFHFCVCGSLSMSLWAHFLGVVSAPTVRFYGPRIIVIRAEQQRNEAGMRARFFSREPEDQFDFIGSALHFLLVVMHLVLRLTYLYFVWLLLQLDWFLKILGIYWRNENASKKICDSTDKIFILICGEFLLTLQYFENSRTEIFVF